MGKAHLEFLVRLIQQCLGALQIAEDLLIGMTSCDVRGRRCLL